MITGQALSKAVFVAWSPEVSVQDQENIASLIFVSSGVCIEVSYSSSMRSLGKVPGNESISSLGENSGFGTGLSRLGVSKGLVGFEEWAGSLL